MTRAARLARLDLLALGSALGLVFAATVVVPASAEDEATPSGDTSRGVRILEAPTPAPADRPTRPPAEQPSAPAAAAPASPPPPSPSATLTPPPATLTPPSATLTPPPATLTPPPATLTPPSATLTPTEPTPPPASPAPSVARPAVQAPPSGDVAAVPAAPGNSPSVAELESLSKGIKVVNSAELTVEILPGPDIASGSKVSFRITTKKAGYLILVDVDPSGKLNQIYPNPMSLMVKSDRESTNLIRPGKPMQLPNPSDVLSRFEFVASPPFGTAMVVALLSERPVQMVDLPDVPPTMLGSASAAELLSKLANELRIPDPKGTGAFLEPHWSFDAKFYAIR
jgi:uncharacterized protein DUF4384